MPGQKWINDKKPKGVIDETILVLGPYDFEDKKLVFRTLDEYTMRMEAVHIVTASFSIPRGVPKFAEQWAYREWWPRSLAMAVWWGQGPKGIRDRDDHLVKYFMTDHRKHNHCILFYQEDMPFDMNDLIEKARDNIAFKRFKIVEV